MKKYLLDTNVISELSKPHPNAQVIAWFDSEPEVFLSVLTIGELLRGVVPLRSSNPRRADALEAWLQRIRAEFAGSILDLDEAVAERWAALPLRRTLPAIDSLIAATALAHGLTVATRNVADFADAGVEVCNPFE